MWLAADVVRLFQASDAGLTSSLPCGGDRDGRLRGSPGQNSWRGGQNIYLFATLVSPCLCNHAIMQHTFAPAPNPLGFSLIISTAVSRFCMLVSIIF